MSVEKDVSKDYLVKLGKHIKKKRLEAGMSLEKFGLEVGLTRMQVHRIENGLNITMTTLLKLSLGLDMKPDELIRFDYKFKKDDLEKLISYNSVKVIKKTKNNSGHY